MNKIKAEFDEEELRRICGILEGIANRSDMSADEIEALETAAIGLTALNMARSTQSAFKKLLDAHNGVLPADLNADLRKLGIDVDALESDSR